MKVLILGLGKSGTTALLQKVAGGLPDCAAFSGGLPGKYLGDHQNAVYKHIYKYKERKYNGVDIYTEHLNHTRYDRLIWLVRDPRDIAVSRMLYRWHNGYRGRKKQFRAHLEHILQKEQNPNSIPFHTLCRYAGYYNWPARTEDIIGEEQLRYESLLNFVENLGSEWFIFKYEDMLSGAFFKLNEYLGFTVNENAQIPNSSKKSKVIRKKSAGDWRHWFTREDVDLFKPVYTPYMNVVGYDCDDWNLNPRPLIEPDYSSKYIMGLIRKKRINVLRKWRDRAGLSWIKF